MAEGGILLNQIGNRILKLRNFKENTFDQLPVHLAKMKQNNSETKYIIKI